MVADLAQVNRVLDLGCGSGQTLEAVLSSHSPRTVVGVDFSKKMCDLVSIRIPQSSIVRDDLAVYCLTTPAEFDLVTAIGALEFIPKLPDLLSILGRLLVVGGTFVFTYEPVVIGSEGQEERESISTGRRAYSEASFTTFRWNSEEVRQSLQSWGEVKASLLFTAYKRAGIPVIYDMLKVTRVA